MNTTDDTTMRAGAADDHAAETDSRRPSDEDFNWDMWWGGYMDDLN